MIGDRRAPDAPPVDSLAESLVLTRLLHNPSWIDRYDVGPLLNFPEHRMIWQSLQRVHRTYPKADFATFFGCWLTDIQEQHPDVWWNLLDLVHPLEESRRAEEEYQAARARDPDGFDPAFSSYRHDFDWWLARLQRIADARRLVSTAQRIAELAWSEDVEGARAIAASVRPKESVRVDV